MTLLQQNFVTAKPINFYYLVCKLDRVQYPRIAGGFLFRALALLAHSTRSKDINNRPPTPGKIERWRPIIAYWS